MLWVALSLTASAVGAQGHQHRPEASGWSWAHDGRVFFNANLQVRKFRDFHQVESQNWFMAEASHAVPVNLRESYGRPWSVHAFLRWAAKR